MRHGELLELAGVKRFKEMSATEVLQYIRIKLGNGPIKLLGKGAHGVAIQIGDSVYKFWMVDSAYSDFVDYCKKYPKNPFLPRFLSDVKKMPAFFMRHKDAPDFVNYVKVEKLDSSRSYWEYTFTFNLPHDAQGGVGDITQVNMELLEAFLDNIGETDDLMQAFIERYSEYKSFRYKMEYLPENLKLFLSTMNDLKRMNHKLDLHEDNFMWRGDQLVIIDPLFNAWDHYLNKEFAKYDKVLHTELQGKPAVQSKYAQQKDQEKNQ